MDTRDNQLTSPLCTPTCCYAPLCSHFVPSMCPHMPLCACMCHLCASYMSSVYHVPSTCRCMPLHALCAPCALYMPLCTPLCAFYMPLCAPYGAPTCPLCTMCPLHASMYPPMCLLHAPLCPLWCP